MLYIGIIGGTRGHFKARPQTLKLSIIKIVSVFVFFNKPIDCYLSFYVLNNFYCLESETYKKLEKFLNVFSAASNLIYIKHAAI